MSVCLAAAFSFLYRFCFSGCGFRHWREQLFPRRTAAIRTLPRRQAKTRFTVLPPVLPTQHLAHTRCLAPLLPATTPLLAPERWTSTREMPIRPLALQHCYSTPAHKTRPLE